jgi:hypothetical protein
MASQNGFELGERDLIAQISCRGEHLQITIQYTERMRRKVFTSLITSAALCENLAVGSEGSPRVLSYFTAIIIFIDGF